MSLKRYPKRPTDPIEYLPVMLDDIQVGRARVTEPPVPTLSSQGGVIISLELEITDMEAVKRLSGMASGIISIGRHEPCCTGGQPYGTHDTECQQAFSDD